MHPGQIVLFTGPAAAGKSTIAEAWASGRAWPTAWFDHDDARFLLRSGYIARSAAHADAALMPEAERQWLLAAAVCESMAETYRGWGYDMAISAFRPPGQWQGCWKHLDRMQPLIIVLLPSLECLIARDKLRTGRRHVGEESVRRGYRYDWQSWHDHPRAVVLDTSALSIDETIHNIERVIQHRQNQQP